MATCALRIVLDNPDHGYLPGEPVRGSVEVRVDQNTGGRLTLTRLWRTQGLGNPEKGGDRALHLFGGDLSAGNPTTHAFEFPAPDGPFTYHGTNLHLTWMLVAHAKTERAKDASVAREFRVVPPPAGQPESDRPAQPLPVKAPLSTTYAGGCRFWLGTMLLLGVGVPVLLFGAFAAYFFLFDRRDPSGLVVVGFCFFLGGMFTLFGVRQWRRGREGPRLKQLGRKLRAEVTLDSARVRRGDVVKCSVRLQPRRQTVVGPITASLVATEVVRRKEDPSGLGAAVGAAADVEGAPVSGYIDEEGR
jgi:hypothetical protein